MFLFILPSSWFCCLRFSGPNLLFNSFPWYALLSVSSCIPFYVILHFIHSFIDYKSDEITNLQLFILCCILLYASLFYSIFPFAIYSYVSQFAIMAKVSVPVRLLKCFFRYLKVFSVFIILPFIFCQCFHCSVSSIQNIFQFHYSMCFSRVCGL